VVATAFDVLIDVLQLLRSALHSQANAYGERVIGTARRECLDGLHHEYGLETVAA
jgi:hypothetical protein